MGLSVGEALHCLSFSCVLLGFPELSDEVGIQPRTRIPVKNDSFIDMPVWT